MKDRDRSRLVPLTPGGPNRFFANLSHTRTGRMASGWLKSQITAPGPASRRSRSLSCSAAPASADTRFHQGPSDLVRLEEGGEFGLGIANGQLWKVFHN